MPTQILDYFASLVADDNTLPLTEAGFAVAQIAYPDLDLEDARSHIDTLAQKLKARIPPEMTTVDRVRALIYYFYRELGFGPNQNDYYDPDNSYLNAVIKSRRGNPLALAVLMMEFATQIDVPLKGISFPTHFLLRLTLPIGEVIIDPIDGSSLSKGRLQEMLDPYLEQQGYTNELTVPLSLFLQTATSREILIRMLGNLKAIYLQEKRWERLLAVQERLVILQPDVIEEVRDRGLAHANLKQNRRALLDLEAYIAAKPDAEDALELQESLTSLREAD